MIENGKKVKFEYTLHVKGELTDSSEGKTPLEYTHGAGMIIPGLESQMEGLKIGDEKDVTVSPEDGYGPVDENAVVEVPKSNLAADVIPQVGALLQVKTPDGRALTGMIVELREETMVLNFNHPLAGQELAFHIKIVDVQ